MTLKEIRERLETIEKFIRDKAGTKGQLKIIHKMICDLNHDLFDAAMEEIDCASQTENTTSA